MMQIDKKFLDVTSIDGYEYLTDYFGMHEQFGEEEANRIERYIFKIIDEKYYLASWVEVHSGTVEYNMCFHIENLASFSACETIPAKAIEILINQCGDLLNTLKNKEQIDAVSSIRNELAEIMVNDGMRSNYKWIM